MNIPDEVSKNRRNLENIESASVTLYYNLPVII